MGFLRSCAGKWREREREEWDRKMHDVGRVQAMLAAKGKTFQVRGETSFHTSESLRNTAGTPQNACLAALHRRADFVSTHLSVTWKDRMKAVFLHLLRGKCCPSPVGNIRGGFQCRNDLTFVAHLI